MGIGVGNSDFAFTSNSVLLGVDADLTDTEGSGFDVSEDLALWAVFITVSGDTAGALAILATGAVLAGKALVAGEVGALGGAVGAGRGPS